MAECYHHPRLPLITGHARGSQPPEVTVSHRTLQDCSLELEDSSPHTRPHDTHSL